MKRIILGISAFIIIACNATSKKADTTAQDTLQTDSTTTVWDKQYGGVDKSYDTLLLSLREKIAPRFQVFEFTDPKTGTKITYNLYTPQNIDPNQKYPLVMFIADASTAGKGAKAPLMQGYGGIIWATDESQAKNPAFVLVPAYDTRATSDEWEVSEQVVATPNLVRHVIENYPIDANRVYTTGQSMGGMISFYLNCIEPNLFAASMFVGSQWDINVLKPLRKAKFIYIVSAGDPKASKGMAEVIAMMKQNGVKYGEIEFSAKLPQDQKDQIVSELLSKGNKINFIRFESSTVLPPQGTTMKAGEHMYSFDYAYLLTPAREWLFEQRKK